MTKPEPRQPLSPDEVAAWLQDYDILPTPQRLEIAQVLFGRHQHLSADQILALVNENDQHHAEALATRALSIAIGFDLAGSVLVLLRCPGHGVLALFLGLFLVLLLFFDFSLPLLEAVIRSSPHATSA